jgi:hypothetical protein
MRSTLRTKIEGLLVVLPIVVGLAAAGYKFGPRARHKTAEPQVAASAPVSPVATSQPAGEDAQLFSLFGMYQTITGKGRVQSTVADYLNSLEALYVQRGYKKIENFGPAKTKRTKGKTNPAAGEAKFFQRDDTQGIASISATGTDADYQSNEVAVVPYTFTTVVTPAENGSADWASYKMALDQGKLAQLDKLIDGDFPGNDPALIPRPTGLQRIYALSSGNTSIAIYKSKQFSHDALMMKYLDEMPRHGWQLDSTASAEASKIAAGVMCFTRGARQSLIWVTVGKNNEFSNVTISLH